MKTEINGKKYDVSYVFNMVGNWYFTDDDGVSRLVDAEDAQEWAEDNGIKWEGAQTVIAYAQELAGVSGGVFWWKEKTNI